MQLTRTHTARWPRAAGPLGNMRYPTRRHRARNRLTSSVTGTQTTTYTNDLYGRRTAKSTDAGSAAYTWDALGHLTGIASQDSTITYAYGITGMREYKSVE